MNERYGPTSSLCKLILATPYMLTRCVIMSSLRYIISHCDTLPKTTTPRPSSSLLHPVTLCLCLVASLREHFLRVKTPYHSLLPPTHISLKCILYLGLSCSQASLPPQPSPRFFRFDLTLRTTQYAVCLSLLVPVATEI